MFIKRPDDLADFCVLDSAPESRLSTFERLTLLGGAELERAIKWIIKNASAFAIFDRARKQELNLNVPEFLEAVKFYREHQNEWHSDPGRFFAPPHNVPAVTSKLVHGLRDGTIIDIEFPSAYQPRKSSLRNAFETYPENMRVRARYWQHSEQAGCTIVALHGWTMGDPRLNSLTFLPGHFYKLGYDVVLVDLPFHGRRKPANLAQDQIDAIFPGSDVSMTNEISAQFIHDLRSLRMFLEQYGAKKTGVIGMSLGGYFASLWACLDRLDFCIPVVPVASMADIAWKILSDMPAFPELQKQGLTRDAVNSAYSLHSPLNHKPQTPGENVLILAGLGDDVVPASHPKALWQHWQKPKIAWLKGGHMAQLKSKRAISTIVDFLDTLTL